MANLTLVQSTMDNPAIVALTRDGKLLRYTFARFGPSFDTVAEPAGSGWGANDLLW